MYELIILTLLSRHPMHGYLIAHVINDIIGPFARISNGRLYPLLAKLEAEGLITPQEAPDSAGTGERRQRSYAITESGRQRFHQLMMDTTSNPGDYGRLFWIKVPYLDALQLHERLYLVDHYINYCQTHIFHLTGEAESLKRDHAQSAYMSQEQLEATLLVMRHTVGEWQLSADDARALREKILGRAEHGAPESAPAGSTEQIRPPAPAAKVRSAQQH
jgi:DNA-binding PadR family transcriptional regulator